MKMNTESKIIRRRRVISLRFKLRILDRIKKGERPAHVARSLGLNESTVRSIYVNEKKIRTSVGLGCPTFACHAGRCRPKILEKMETELNKWITTCLEKGDPPDTLSVKQKALSIYNSLRDDGETPTTPQFAASAGWFDRFRKRFLIKSTQIKEEITVEQESVSCSEDIIDSPAHNHSLKYEKKGNRKRKQQKAYTSNEVGVKNNKKRANTWLSTSNNNSNHEIKLNDMRSDSVDSNSDPSKQIPEFPIQQVPVYKFETNTTDVEQEPFSLKSLKPGLTLAKQLELYFVNLDPSIERSTKFKMELNNCLAPYTNIYRNLTQLKITDYFPNYTK